MNRTSHSGWWRLLAALLVPLIIAGGLLASNWRAQPRMHRVTAAIVNDDQMITYNGQTIPVGRLLAGKLVDNHESNITWELSDDSHADAGLRSGKYAAVVTIPKNFSADAMSYATSPETAHQAAVDVKVSKQAQALDPALSTMLLNDATTKLNNQLSQLYLSGLFTGFSGQADQLSKVADATKQLADAGDKLADGNGQLASGLDQTSAGVKQLDQGVQQLNQGTQQYATGVTQYTSGVDQAASGMAQLNQQLPQIQQGTHSYVDGVDQVLDGVGRIAQGAQGLSSGLDQLQAQLKQVQSQMPDQVNQAALARPELAGVKQQVVQGIVANLPQNPTAPTVPPVSATDPKIAGAAQQVCAGMAQAPAPAGIPMTQLQTNTCVAAVSQALATTATSTAQQTADRAAAQSQQALAAQLTKIVSPAVDAGVQFGDNVGWNAGVGAALQGLNTADPKTGATLAGGAQQLAQGAQQLSGATSKLRDGGTQLTGGIDQFAGGVSQLNGGMQQLSARSSQVSSGATQLASGTQQLADQVPQLTTGTEKLADASHQLADGAKQMAQGQHQLADGFQHQAAVPNYTPERRDKLSQAISAPVQLTSTDVITEANPTSALLISLVALWIGALVTFVARRPVPRSVTMGNRSAAGNLAAALLPGLGVVELQALALTLLLGITLKPGASHLAGLTALMLVAGATFAVVNHALAALFGWLGRLLSVAIATLAVAFGLTAAVPAALAPISAASPLSSAIQSAGGVAAGGSGITGGVLVMLAWLVVAFLLSAVAVMRAQQVRPAQLKPVAVA